MAALFDVLLRGVRDTGLFAGKVDLDTAVANVNTALSGLNTKVDNAIVDLTAVANAAGFTTRIVLTTSQTWTAPATKKYRVVCVGGGGNGGFIQAGRAGAVSTAYISLAGGATVACTIGGAGGATKFGAYLSATGAAGPSAGFDGGTNGTGYGGGGGAGTSTSPNQAGRGSDGGADGNGSAMTGGAGGPGAIFIEY